LHQELAVRAARVGALLVELESVPAVVARRAPRRFGRRWAAAGLAVAAALAAAFVLAPKHVESIPAPAIAGTPAAIPAAAAPVTPAAVNPVPLARARHARAVRRREPQLQYYLALDDEPIDTGTVMRVALASGVEADVIVDSGGRPRAIRAVR
jgi:hypothetical protein